MCDLHYWGSATGSQNRMTMVANPRFRKGSHKFLLKLYINEVGLRAASLKQALAGGSVSPANQMDLLLRDFLRFTRCIRKNDRTLEAGDPSCKEQPYMMALSNTLIHSLAHLQRQAQPSSVVWEFQEQQE